MRHVDPSDRSAVKKTYDSYQGEGCQYYIDISKAFDSVVYDKLCSKLSLFGFIGKLLLLGIPGLRVRIGSCLSEACDVISDVPPGTPLGTVLFLLFIKDLEELFYSNITVKLFADDVKIYIVINDIVDVNMSQKGLDSPADWSDK